MKGKNFFIKVFIVFLFFSPKVFAFDSVSVFISSPNYDYLNPTFENYYDSYNYEYSGRVFFERHSGSLSDLFVRTYNFSGDMGDIVVVSNGAKNINPSFTSNMAVWQSDKNGNWDIYYSIFNGTSWSAPMIVDSTSEDETNPKVHFTGYSDIRGLIYQKGNDIYFRHFRNGAWQTDTNITGSIAENCSSALLNGSHSNMAIFFLKEISPDNNVAMRQYVSISHPTYSVAWGTQSQLTQLSSPKNIRLSSGYDELLNYDLDTLGVTQSYGYELSLNNNIVNFSSGIPGSSSGGKGSFFAMIFDNMAYNYFFAYALLNKRPDSTFLIASKYKNVSNLYGQSHFYLGDLSVNSRFDIGRPVRGVEYDGFRIRLIWEKELNGKIALFESNYFDFLSEINHISNTAEDYNLYQNYPNPFNPSTKIKFSIPANSFVNLKIYDLQGREVMTIVNEKLNPGSYEYELNGEGLTSGVYFYRLEANDFIEIKRMMLVK
jgi:hypothetical protein